MPRLASSRPTQRCCRASWRSPGIEAQAIRSAAREPGFLAGVLQFIVAHEPTLIAFAEYAGIAPAAVLKAMRSLPQGDDSYEAST